MDVDVQHLLEFLVAIGAFCTVAFGGWTGYQWWQRRKVRTITQDRDEFLFALKHLKDRGITITETTTIPVVVKSLSDMETKDIYSKGASS